MRRSRQTGLTLIEVLVALVVLAAGVLSVSKLISGSLVRTDANIALTHAAQLASQEMEDLRSLDYAVLASRTAPGTPVTWTGLQFTVQSTVTRNLPAPNMSQIAVSVTWSQRGQSYAYNLQSIYADPRN